MKKFMKAIAAIILMTAVVVAAGCKKTEYPNNGGGNNGGNGGGNNNGGGGGGGDSPTLTTEGIYLGVIGFNDQLYTKDISILNSTTLQGFKDFIDGFVARDLTALYYADYVALQKLQAFPEPPQLTNVALVTFTDGLDNLSTENNEQFQYDPEGYGTRPAYRNALHEKIVNDKVHGKNINAYTIGLRGNDVSSSSEFSQNMNALASKPGNVFEVANMSQALRKFDSIAESLYSVTTTVSLTVKIPGGVVDDGQHIRFAFDNVNAPNNTMYIEGTYNKRTNPRQLDNLSYYGFQDGASSIASISNDGGFYYFKFENLNLSNGDPISQTIVDRIVMWKETSEGTGWDRESEFHPNNNTNIEEDKSSAIIMLVLDCTTSLGSDFSTMQMAAKSFVETLVSSNNGGGGGGGNTQSYDISVSASPANGGTVTGGGTYQDGQSCTVKATANSGYTFSKWTLNGIQVSTNANYSFTVSGNRDLVAKFTTNGGGNTIPAVTTSTVTNVTQTSATCGGNVTNDGGATVTERGIWWSTNETANPSVTGYHQSCGSGTGTFTLDLTGLSANTTYYVRAYAKNSQGTAYGTKEPFTTSSSVDLIEDWLYYGAWNNHSACWGFSYGRNVEWAVMFPASMLGPYSGTCITDVDAYIGVKGWCKVHIYKGGTSRPTTLIYEDEIYVDNIGWNSFEIVPLQLTTNQPLWVSISCYNYQEEYPMGCCEGIGNRNSRWFYDDEQDSWIDFMTMTDGNSEMTWEIQVYVTNSVKGSEGHKIPLPQASVVKMRNGKSQSYDNKAIVNPNEGPKKYKR